MTEPLRAWLDRATDRLSGAGVSTPRADALLLAGHVLEADRGEVERRALLGHLLPAEAVAPLDALLDRRARREPLQHLTGVAPFRRLELAVGPGVFVPRPETEGTAGLAIAAARSAGETPVVVDLCTGSGAIALAVADEVPGARVHGVELDPGAHAWAQRNRERTALPVDLRLGDATTALTELDGTVDVVVANPPYIPDGMVPREIEVRDHDPHVALFGRSADGLAVPLAVADRAGHLLRAGGRLVMEHADSQGESLPQALRDAGWLEVRDHLDLADRPRTVTATAPAR